MKIEVIKQRTNYFFFTGEILNDNPVFKKYGSLNYHEFTMPTLDFIASNPRRWKDYEVTELKAQTFKDKERLKELVHASKVGQLAKQFIDEMEEIKTRLTR